MSFESSGDHSRGHPAHVIRLSPPPDHSRAGQLARERPHGASDAPRRRESEGISLAGDVRAAIAGVDCGRRRDIGGVRWFPPLGRIDRSAIGSRRRS